MLENNGTTSSHFLKEIIFSSEYYTQVNYKPVWRYNLDSFRQDSESLFPTYPFKELISGYIPVKGWNKSGQCKWILWETQDPKNSDSNPGEE